GDLLAAHAPHLGGALVEEVLAIEEDPATDNAAGWLGDETHQREARHRLARSRLAHEGQGLPSVEHEAHAVYGLGDATTGEEGCLQIFDHQQGGVPHGGCSLTLQP